VRLAAGSRAAKVLELDNPTGDNYFAVAALRVKRVWQDHQEAAGTFTPRQYVALPTPTPYPPNLAFSRHPEAADAMVCYITFDKDAEPVRAHLPGTVTDKMRNKHYLAYLQRQISKRLRAAECEFETVDGHQCLQLMPAGAPVIAPDWWDDDKPMNVDGVDLSDAQAEPFRNAIAAGRAAKA